MMSLRMMRLFTGKGNSFYDRCLLVGNRRNDATSQSFAHVFVCEI